MDILLIDNFDSFTNNIAESVYGATGTWPRIEPNTRSLDELALDCVDAVIIGPGPGNSMTATDVGVSHEILKVGQLPILGICLGHQLIAQHFGSSVSLKHSTNHGVTATITHDGDGLFADVPNNISAVQYNSWVVDACEHPIRATAIDHNGAIMALQHASRPIFGLQFHPESVSTDYGDTMIRNFLRLAAQQKNTEQDQLVLEAYAAAGGSTHYELVVDECPEITPVSLLAGGKLGFWIDSEDSGHKDTDYSYLAASSESSLLFTYDVISSCLTITGPNMPVQVYGDDPWSMLDTVIRNTSVNTPKTYDASFAGGLVGYFGYELKDCGKMHAEMRHRSMVPDLQLLLVHEYYVLHNITGEVRRCRLIPPDSALLAKHHDANGHAPATAGDSHAGVSTTSTTPIAYSPGPVPARNLRLRDTPPEYIEKVEQAKWQIACGETYEVCLTTSFTVDTTIDPLDAYVRMRTISPVPYGAYLRFPDVAVASNSPERFIRVTNEGWVESKPIKGTRKRSSNEGDDAALVAELRNSVKDTAENLMITDLVRHDLSKVCRHGTVVADPVFAIESYASVHQMVSTVGGQLGIGRSAIHAIRECFPGGSMTGAPKIRTMRIIETLETGPRGIYSGALGWLSFSGSADLSIVIRTAVIKNGTAHVGVGGAVTALSDPQEEFDEVLVKASIPYAALSQDY